MERNLDTCASCKHFIPFSCWDIHTQCPRCQPCEESLSCAVCHAWSASADWLSKHQEQQGKSSPKSRKKKLSSDQSAIPQLGCCTWDSSDRRIWEPDDETGGRTRTRDPNTANRTQEPSSNRDPLPSPWTRIALPSAQAAMVDGIGSVISEGAALVGA